MPTDAWTWFQPWWPDLSAFLAMGKHGVYVWGSVIACGVVLVAEQAMLAGQARRCQRHGALMADIFSKEKMPSPPDLHEDNAMKEKA